MAEQVSFAQNLSYVPTKVLMFSGPKALSHFEIVISILKMFSSSLKKLLTYKPMVCISDRYLGTYIYKSRGLSKLFWSNYKSNVKKLENTVSYKYHYYP